MTGHGRTNLADDTMLTAQIGGVWKRAESRFHLTTPGHHENGDQFLTEAALDIKGMSASLTGYALH